MVRTKTEARKTTGGKLPRDMTWAIRSPTVYNNRFFNDHTGKPALMSWKCREINGPLPPISSWVYYMVHPDVPQEFDGCALHLNLTEEGRFCRGGPFRYEFLFLPGATVEECHAHYLGEMKARGTIWRQIRKEEEDSDEQEEEDSETEGINSANERHEGYEMVYDSESDPDSTADADNQLPGLVWPKYDNDDCDFVGCRGWFFIYHDANTDCSGGKAEKRAISLVTFDPIPYPYEEDGVSDEHNPMKNPICSQPMPVRHEYFESSLGGWMQSRMRANWEEEANEATHEARKLGWTSW
ncbi:hypothetical protein FSPOR_6654 [Fusarium sporotrichioides]|uniref:Uncharacterized protein n=1 Tax=Fusarium sporotrichioides TaxID=5514 RepID=A0A395S1I8_FUSSP|nr:hypothetical protein FSPOR_6654 [Fusarium sporotrichioides]